MIYVQHIVNWFDSSAYRDGKEISIPKMMSLLYYAQCWHMEMSGHVLFMNPIEAFEYGPVIPDVFRNVEYDKTVELTEKQENILEFIYQNYGCLSCRQLEKLNKREDGPWYLTIKKYGYFSKISPWLMRDCFRKYREKYEISLLTNPTLTTK